MEPNLIFVAYHKETSANPACIFKFYLENGVIIDERYIVRGQQIYARTNKILKDKRVTVEDFKGKKGIGEVFANQKEFENYLYLLIDEGYLVKRTIPHQMNRFVDNVFESIMGYQMRKTPNTLPK